MKDKQGREIDREFAPNVKNPTEDPNKMVYLPEKEKYNVDTTEDGRPVVTKKG